MPEQLGLNIDACAFCGAPATKLCDFQIARILSRLPEGEKNIATCDTPFCANCGKPISRVFLDGVDRRGRRRGWSQTIDYCLVHKLHPHTLLPPAKTVAEVEIIRAEIREAIERTRNGECLLKP